MQTHKKAGRTIPRAHIHQHEVTWLQPPDTAIEHTPQIHLCWLCQEILPRVLHTCNHLTDFVKMTKAPPVTCHVSHVTCTRCTCPRSLHYITCNKLAVAGTTPGLKSLASTPAQAASCKVEASNMHCSGCTMTYAVYRCRWERGFDNLGSAALTQTASVLLPLQSLCDLNLDLVIG